MRQVDSNLYTVAPGEIVRIQFTGTGVSSALATLTVDGFAPPPPPPGGSWTFTVTRPAGQTHFAVFQCSFPAGTLPAAKFDVAVEGSGATFRGPTVTPAGLLRQTLTFEVA